MRKLANLAAMVLWLGCQPAFGFDYERYQATDLDALLTQSRPRSGLDLHGTRPLKLRVTLVAYGESCETFSLKTSLKMAGVVVDEQHPVTRCITVRSAKGRDLRMFIQDVVADFLPKEVPLGGQVMLFAIHVYSTPEGPGLLVNEFSTDAGSDPAAGAKL